MAHPTASLSPRIIEALHTETMVLADETSAYFDGPGRIDRDALAPRGRVLFACESLKATTRLMQLLTWLAAHRPSTAGTSASTIDRTTVSDEDALRQLPSAARRLILAGIELHERALRMAEGQTEDMVTPLSPARGLLDRLERAF